MAQAPAVVTARSGAVPANRITLPLLRIRERRLLLAAVDGALAGGVLLLSYQVWKSAAHPPSNDMTSIPWAWVMAGTLSWLAISWLAGAYDLDVADRLVSAVKRCLTVTVFTTVEGLGAYSLFLKTYPRPALAIALPAVPIAVLLWRAVYASALHGPASAVRILVLGDSQVAASLGLVASASQYYRVVGSISSEEDSIVDLPGEVERLGAHRIVVAPRVRLTNAMVAGLTAAVERGTEVLDFNSAYEEMAGKVAVDHAGDHWLAALPTRVTTSAFEEMAMRGLDIAGGIVGGAISLLLLPPVAAAIALTSKGPVFYHQQRLGRGGRPFTIYKLRTMRRDAEDDGVKWAGVGDTRVTPIGRFLRRTHLDEVPQFWNILRGEMSLVGPRPERIEFTDELSRQIPFYRLRLSVRPGLTGQKQIKVGYAATKDEHLEVLRHDLYYIKHRSLALNLAIIARTLGSVVGQDGR